MAAASRILPTSGGGFGASDNGLHRGAIPERAAVFSAVCTVRRMPGKLVPRDLWRCPAGRPILLHNSVGLGTRALRRAPLPHYRHRLCASETSAASVNDQRR